MFGLAVGVLWAAQSQAQTVASWYAMNLSPAKFNLPSHVVANASPGLSDPVQLLATFYTDGSMTLSGSLRGREANRQTGETRSIGGVIEWIRSATGSIGISKTKVEGSTETKVSTNGSLTTNASSGWMVKEALTFRLEGNMVVAVVTITNQDGLVMEEIVYLGYFEEDGTFREYPTASRDGMSIFKDAQTGPKKDAFVDPKHAPARDSKTVGHVDGDADKKWVLVTYGYWVTVATMGGKVIGIEIKPEYQFVYVGYAAKASSVSPYETPNGGKLLP